MKRSETVFGTHGLEHPDERFEFARFCLLNYYGRDAGFTAELGQLALRHNETLESVARQQLGGISELADYRISWGILSFLARDLGSGKAAHPLKGHIEPYRMELRDLARRWGLTADWCAPSLHVALLAPRVFPGNFGDADRFQDAAVLFMWDLRRQGRPPYDTLLTLPSLLVHSDATGRQVDMRLLSHAGERVYYDPRMDRWEDTLARVRILLGRKRLSSACKQELLRRRREIDSTFAAEGYGARRKPHMMKGQHALARWTYWTYRAICPPRETTREMLDSLGRLDVHTEYMDRAIKHVLQLLRLPPRPVRPR